MNFVVECRHNGTNFVSQPSGNTSNVENYVQHTQNLMKKSWETGTCIENTDPVHPLIISIKETTEEDNDSDDWPVRLE
jgi:hypothetical protein